MRSVLLFTWVLQLALMCFVLKTTRLALRTSSFSIRRRPRLFIDSYIPASRNKTIEYVILFPAAAADNATQWRPSVNSPENLAYNLQTVSDEIRLKLQEPKRKPKVFVGWKMNNSSTLMAVLIFLILAILDPQLRLISQSSCQASPR